MYEIMRWVSLVILWLCIGLNVFALVINMRAYRKWSRKYEELSEDYFKKLYKESLRNYYEKNES